MVLLSRVTAPFLARAPALESAPVCIVMLVRAITVPTKAVSVPRVAELPTCQKTLQAWAPPRSATVLLLAVIRVLPAWKTNTASGSPWASRVRVPVRAMAVEAPYTPGTSVWPPRSWSVLSHDREPAGRVVVRGRQVVLGLEGDGVRGVDGAVEHEARREPGHGTSRG